MALMAPLERQPGITPRLVDMDDPPACRDGTAEERLRVPTIHGRGYGATVQNHNPYAQ